MEAEMLKCYFTQAYRNTDEFPRTLKKFSKWLQAAVLCTSQLSSWRIRSTDRSI